MREGIGNLTEMSPSISRVARPQNRFLPSGGRLTGQEVLVIISPDLLYFSKVVAQSSSGASTSRLAALSSEQKDELEAAASSSNVSRIRLRERVISRCELAQLRDDPRLGAGAGFTAPGPPQSAYEMK